MVQLSFFDLIIISLFLFTTIFIGLYVSKKIWKKNTISFSFPIEICHGGCWEFPWWPQPFQQIHQLITDIVRTKGVSALDLVDFLITGLLTVFVYAKLAEINVNTDMEFYELRYGGKPAAFLRKFRALYLGVIFNVITMSAVNLAAIKIGAYHVRAHTLQTILIGGIITSVFSSSWWL